MAAWRNHQTAVVSRRVLERIPERHSSRRIHPRGLDEIRTTILMGDDLMSRVGSLRDNQTLRDPRITEA